ncbi:MAG TPA: hypothetical protein VGJ26_02380 [Pirellulales bacterium]|jgi:hypothetical protein
MSDPSRFSDDRVDALVRSYLGDDAGRVDLEANLQAVQARLEKMRSGESVNRRRPAFRKGVRWAMSLAAVLLVAGGTAYFVLDPTPTSAYSIMVAASDALTPGSDRCYRIDIAARGDRFKKHPILRNIAGALVWTRGDRFYLDSAGDHRKPEDGRQFIMGQDENHKIWVVGSGNRGLRYNRGEVPPILGALRSTLNLDLEKLSKQFLQHFDLEIEAPGPQDDPKTVVLRATIKPDHDPMAINGARLTIERNSNVIRKLELSRTLDGATLGTVTFTLVGAEPQADSSYRLESHLPPGAEILSHDQAAERGKALRSLLAQ